jgi:cytochrome c553
MLVIKQRLGNPQATEQALHAGRDRALLCSYCHGEDGNSVKPEVPNLAGQNPVYLLSQIDKFADGRRKNFVMNSLAKKFTLDDKVNLAIYFSKQKVHNKKVDVELAAKGRLIYSGTCTSCHGARGRGNVEYARLAGQRPAYVKMTLNRFRKNARHPEQVDKTARHSVIMESVVKELSDEQIEALAAYIAQIP